MSKHIKARAASKALVLVIIAGLSTLLLSAYKAENGSSAFVRPGGRSGQHKVRDNRQLRAQPQEAAGTNLNLLSDDFDVEAARARLNDVIKLEVEEPPVKTHQEFGLDDLKRLALLVLSFAYLVAGSFLLFDVLFGHDRTQHDLQSEFAYFLVARLVLRSLRERKPRTL